MLLCLDMGMQPQPASQAEQPQAEQPQGTSAAFNASADATAPPTASSTPAQRGPAAPSTAEPTAEAAGTHPADSAVPAGLATPAAAAPSSKPEDPIAAEQTPAMPKKTAEERQQTATQLLRESIRTMFMSNGLLSQQQLEHASTICIGLLRHLHAWGSVWKVPEADGTEAFSQPEPAASTQAVVQVLARVTKSHKIALKVRQLSLSSTQSICNKQLPCFIQDDSRAALLHDTPFAARVHMCSEAPAAIVLLNAWVIAFQGC